jgi:hydrogenase maturation factor
MRVLELAEDRAVCVDEDGARHEVAVDLVEGVGPGGLLLVHAGVAIGAPS